MGKSKELGEDFKKNWGFIQAMEQFLNSFSFQDLQFKQIYLSVNYSDVLGSGRRTQLSPSEGRKLITMLRDHVQELPLTEKQIGSFISKCLEEEKEKKH